MTVSIVRGDADHLPLPDNSVDLLVTSPPYWALRSYQDGGTHYEGQLGSEPTPGEFVDALIDCTYEWMRVLKPSASMWINLGDKYAGGGGYSPDAPSNVANRKRQVGSSITTPDLRPGAPKKSLIGIPWRYALRCIDDLGLILRAEVIWAKPNGLPESVTDRVRRSHEQWFHFTLQPRYYSAVDEIREAQVDPDRKGWNGAAKSGRTDGVSRDRGWQAGELNYNPLGKLPGSVWTVPTQPLTVPAHLGVDHFAAFPMEWPRRIIRGWSPPGVCVACGEGRRPVSSVADLVPRGFGNRQEVERGWHTGDPAKRALGVPASERERTITGYACACPDTAADTTPSVVLDPFGGTGTTALVAHALGRHGISVDMSADYCRLAAWRTTDAGQLAAAMQVEKPAPVMDGQGDLFSGDAA